MGDEELQKKTKTLKLTTGILIGLVLVMFVVVFIPSSNEISWPTKILPFSFLPLVIINLLNTRKLMKEIESRKEN